MALLKVLTYPDNRLRNKAKNVTKFDESLREFCNSMLETMYTQEGIGLAATQVGVAMRIVVMDLSDQRNDPHCYINPRIVSSEGTQLYQEGCLSLPGIYAEVERSAVIELQWFDPQGKEQTSKLTGLHSICIQHELDHLQGILFIDHLNPEMQKKAKQLISQKIATVDNKFSLQVSDQKIIATELKVE
ncbi:MAG: peptide deformylase [Methylacidiphilales bacterium]|nr:peptide deformylase [Candidatus Methylacidiphilales bacterium]